LIPTITDRLQTMNRSPMLKTVLWGVAALLVTGAAQAQPAWPAAKPITLIVPFTAGGSVDATARLLAEQLG
jgi:tripartite-type tricarboxylate transporter receptor subunit TctC